MGIFNYLRAILFFISVHFLAERIQAQDSKAGTCIDISKVRLVKAISEEVGTSFLKPGQDITSINFSPSKFSPGVPQKRIPNNLVTQKAVLRFSLCNSADTAVGVYFFPGLYYRQITLFRQVDDNLYELPRALPNNRDSIGYRLISLPAHDSAIILAELVFLRTYINTIRPRLIETDYLDSFVTTMSTSHNESELMTYVFCGLLLMMILFSIASFLQGANPEFLYYSGYALFLGVMLLTKAIFTFRTSYLSYFLEDYLDFILQLLGIMFYMIFMQKYLETKTQHPFLYKLYNTGIFLLIGSMLGYSLFHYFTDNFPVENAIENLTKLLLLVMTVIFLVYSLRHWNDKMLRYVFWGNMCLFIFSLFSQSIIMMRGLAMYLPGIFKSALFYYQLGLFLELVFFLMALNYKNKKNLVSQARERERLKADNQMKEYEKELAVFKAQQQERERISADIHDELGSGMTAIRLMSEIAKSKMKENVPAEIDRISHSADEVLNKMNAIIWSMNSGNDTLDNMVSYIRAYALEYLENTSIGCTVNTPDNIEDRELTGDKRRNIFLCIKETLNNTVKHSHATNVQISFSINHNLEIKIADNGTGIDLKNVRQFGNGLKNISRRMASIGGVYEIENDHGTVTKLILPL